MDGMGHGGFARGQTKDLRKGLKTREGRAKLTSFKQCDYYGLRSQNITKYFFELLQEVDGRISFYCCLYRYLWQFTTAGWQLIR